MIAWSGPLSGLDAAAIRGTDEDYEVTAAGKRLEATESMNSEWQTHDRGRDLGWWSCEAGHGGWNHGKRVGRKT